MRCGACHGENLADARFCQQCGHSLEAVCGSCQVANDPGSRFCRKCGSPLGPDAPSPAAADEYADERKYITMLFADIKGSMVMLDGMDPDEARRLVDPVLALMIGAVQRYDGYVAQAPGDGVVALFGAPTAREDHARRALAAALQMQEQIDAYNNRMHVEGGVEPIRIRVGINTGSVVVRSIATGDNRVDYSPIGHSTGIAARLEGLAEPGTILVSDATRRHTEGYFQFRDLGPVEVKGVSERLLVHQVLGVGPLRTRLDASVSQGLTPFIGREVELAQMVSMLELAIGGHGQVAALSGDAGVGKSRLCHEFKSVAAERCVILECRSDSYGKAFPYLPLIDMLKTLFGIDAEDDDDTVYGKVTGGLHEIDPALADATPFLLTLLGTRDPTTPIDGMDPKIQRRRTFDALQRLILGLAQRNPLLIVFEDLHWIDDETASFLTGFARTVQAAPVFLLVNYRPEHVPKWDATTSYTQVHLNALEAAAATTLLDRLLGDDPALDGVKQVVVGTTLGNAFFMEEYIHSLRDQGVLAYVRDGERTVTALAKPSLSTIDMPPTVQGVLAARIDRLAPEHKTFLQMLAVLGTASPLRLIEHMTARGEEELQPMLERLTAAEFIVERPLFPDVEYAFKHALTRETAYSELLLDTRRAWHSDAARAVETYYRDHIDDHCSELAHHYASSDNPLKAVDFLQRAARQATQRSAYLAAIDHLTQAMSFLPSIEDRADRDAVELKVQALLGSALSATRGFAVDEVAEARERARSLCRDTTESADMIRVLNGLGLVYINRGELDRALVVGDELLDLARRRDEPELFASGHELLGMALLRTGDVVGCIAHMAEARRAADAGATDELLHLLDRDPAVTALGFGSLARWLQGFPDAALADARAAVDLAMGATPLHAFNLAYALQSVVWLLQFRRDVELAGREAHAVVEFATEQGFPTWLAHGRVVRGWSSALTGDTEAGLRDIELALAGYDDTGAKVWRPLFMLLQAEALVHVGRSDDAQVVAADALNRAEQMGDYWWKSDLHRLCGNLALAGDQADATAAMRSFRIAQATAIERRTLALELRAIVSQARLALVLAAPAEIAIATSELAGTLERFTEGFETPDLMDATAVLASLRNPSITDDVLPTIVTLDAFVRSAEAASAIDEAVAAGRQMIDAAPDRTSVFVPIDLDGFSRTVPREVRSMRVVLTRSPGDDRIERHPHGSQYLYALDGPVQTYVAATNGWRVDTFGFGSAADGPLADRWHFIPANTWHRSIAPGTELWSIIAIHDDRDIKDEFAPAGADPP